MIRRSAGFAAICLAVSFLLHVLGIGMTFTTETPEQAQQTADEAVTVGSSFDAVADLAVEPVAPEPPEAVEPPLPEEQPTPPPEEREALTSEALVASSNPQETFAPDTGLSPPVSQEVTPPVTPDPSRTQEPAPTEPPEAAPNDVAEAPVIPPVGADPADTQAPEDPQDTAETAAPVDPVQTPEATAQETATAAPAEPAATAPIPEVIAALPNETAADRPETEVQPPQTAESESVESAESGAVSTSIRPPPSRPDAPTSQQASVFGQTDIRDRLRSTDQTIESPLTLYSRDGIDVFGGQSRNNQSQRLSASGGRGPGNSDTTNYVGQVLVHLNRVPPVVVSGRGWARVTFRINPDGSLASVSVIDGSGSSEIDRAARAQVRRGVPFPLPPNGEPRQITFVYRLN